MARVLFPRYADGVQGRDSDFSRGELRARWLSPVAVGVTCGAVAALFWALGFVAALHGVVIGFAPMDLVFHRFLWTGLLFLPLMARSGTLGDLGGIGWRRGLALTLFAGPLFALVSYAGFIWVPLGHGAVIQPSCATLGGLLLATVLLKEPLSRSRLVGALVMVSGLLLLGAEAVVSIGRHGLLGDLAFVAAGLSWAVFGMLLRLWRLDSLRAMMAVSILGLLIYTPIHAAAFGFDRILAMGLKENLIQIVVQGFLAGPLGIYLFARATAALGAGRAATFPSLVPVLGVAIGYLTLGQVPTLYQIAGLATVLLGFRLVIRN